MDWNKQSIQLFLNFFNEGICAKQILLRINHTKNLISFITEPATRLNSQKPKRYPYIVSPAYFERRNDQIPDEAIHYKITTMFRPISFETSYKLLCYMHWQGRDKQIHEVSITISKKDEFKSGIMSESKFLSTFDPFKTLQVKPGQCYYKLKIREEKESYSPEILNLKFTLDGSYGILRWVHSGIQLTGTDALDLYKFFDSLFKLKHVFLADMSTINNTIPLRVIRAIATGQTWYQSQLPNLTLFKCHRFEAIEDEYYSQNVVIRERHLRELQEYKIIDWFKTLNPDDKKTLTELKQKFFRDDDFTQLTLQIFVNKIYQHSKRMGQTTRALYQLNELLLQHLDSSEPEQLDSSEPNFWFLERIQTLLWQGHIWQMKNKPVDEITPKLKM